MTKFWEAALLTTVVGLGLHFGVFPWLRVYVLDAGLIDQQVLALVNPLTFSFDNLRRMISGLSGHWQKTVFWVSFGIIAMSLLCLLSAVLGTVARLARRMRDGFA